MCLKIRTCNLQMFIVALSVCSAACEAVGGIAAVAQEPSRLRTQMFSWLLIVTMLHGTIQCGADTKSKDLRGTTTPTGSWALVTPLHRSGSMYLFDFTNQVAKELLMH
ncbi:hypothetical protein COO60DRAFT_761349 [Scenedesmus sp. NREL 46B-D3]|nr:hypothetical protein COO60DRAFT_761349 [Scenedesmus sp. NREL 46B-D3]